MKSIDETKDLFGYLLAAYRKWQTTGRVDAGGVTVELKVDGESTEPNEAFIAFSQALLTIKPVVATCIPMCGRGIGLVFRDGTQLDLSPSAGQPVQQPQEAWGITGMMGGGNARLPNTFSAPVTGQINDPLKKV